jgi:hypothetical protein
MVDQGAGNGNGNGSEELIWRALQAQLKPGETVLRNVRFSDPRNGDVEADFIVFMPDAGVAVIEVKGGVVSYEDGQWITRSRNTSRRIHPTEQARKAKHALRRYLDRQPEWPHGLVRSAWFVAMPYTEVAGDMGPEGRREHLIGRDDVDELRERIRSLLLNPLNEDPLPPGDWVDDSVTLVLRLGAEAPKQSNERSVKPWLLVGALLVGAALLTALLTVRGGWIAAVSVIVAAAIAFGVLWSRINTSEMLQPVRNFLIGATGIGAALGFAGVVGLYGQDVTTGECSPEYVPCVPISDDVTCGDLKMQVRVIGEDIYNLDRDGDGVGCEAY